jgi:hypothetical protein
MGKAIVYAVMGLITIGLLIVGGIGLKFLIVLFLGRKSKREPQNLSHGSNCPCSLCRPGNTGRLH